MAESRKVADCRQFPSEKNCTLTIAGSEDEVLTVAVRHAVEEHGHEDTPELREQIKGMIKDEWFSLCTHSKDRLKIAKTFI